jgi:riboflavin kinase/FMN adenylyltransferase
MGAELGFDVLGLTLVPDPAEGEVVSSTRIRNLLVGGDVRAAAGLLGRPHEVRGIVEKGDERGRELGFPTANVAIPAGILLPADGVYAGWYQRPDGSVLPAAINLGRRPTFYDDAEESLLEAHLLDFSGDLYGERARVSFVERLRDEVRFDTVDALVAQMHDDVGAVRQSLRR